MFGLLKVGDTRYSQPVTHASTDRAQRCLTAVIRREPVLSTWYGRRQLLIHSNYTSTQHTLTPTTQLLTTTRQHTQSLVIHSITHTLHKLPHSFTLTIVTTTTTNCSTYPFNAPTAYTDQVHSSLYASLIHSHSQQISGNINQHIQLNPVSV